MTRYEQLPFHLLDYFSAHGVEPEDDVWGEARCPDRYRLFFQAS